MQFYDSRMLQQMGYTPPAAQAGMAGGNMVPTANGDVSLLLQL